MIIHGRYSYGNPVLKGELSNVITGAFCSIADSAMFDCGFQHSTNFMTTYPFDSFGWAEPIEYKTKGDVILGNDVWIGEGTTIMSGVRIADGVIVGAGAVVTKSIIEPYSIYAGIPARLRKYRFKPEIVNALMNFKWWDKSDEWIKENIKVIMSKDFVELLK